MSSFTLLKAGTDAGTLALFDPGALPEDFDRSIKHDALELVQKLHAEGRLYWIDPAADGSYTLAVFARDGLPENLKTHVQESVEIPALHLPGGLLYFTGIEYVFRTDDSRLRKHPHTGSRVTLPSGIHRATFHSLEYPDGFEDDMVNAKLTPEQQRHIRRRGNAATVVGLSVIVGFILLVALPLKVWLSVALPCCLTIIAVAVLVFRNPEGKAAEETAQAVQDEYPGWALVFHSVETIPGPRQSFLP